jgi:serine/threonine protein kinase
MKEKAAVSSVAGLCELLGRSRLLAAADMQQLEQRWRKEAREQADLGEFTRWLAANQYATDFQVNMLLRGHVSRLFLGPYKLLDRLGRGSQATIYKAVHRLGRPVAIKVLPPSRARDPQVLARFQGEARLAQGLQHPNVVRARDAGTDQGLHYLVMDYLEGETLREALTRRGRLGLEEAADIACQALQGLQYLHQQGLVHRNLEPANLMLVRPAEGTSLAAGPAGLVVKILDVSLCRPSSGETLSSGQSLSLLTAEGTPGYQAPELAQNAGPADIRADIYSLGCVLYHALAGRPPYLDSVPQRETSRRTMEVLLLLRACNPEVPEELELIVSQMMARDRAQRYSTPDQAAGALRTFLAEERGSLSLPVSPPPFPFSPDVELVEIPADHASEVPEETDWDVVLEPVPNQPPVPAQVLPGPLEFAPAPDHPEAAGVADLAVTPLSPAESGPAVEPPDTMLTRIWDGFSERSLRLGRRDWLLLILGAGSLLAVEAIGWLFGWLARKRSPAKPKAGEEDNER